VFSPSTADRFAVGAHDAYDRALKLEPNNSQFKSGFDAVKRAIDSEARADRVSGDPTAGLGGLFNDPQLFQKLAGNPKTAAFLSDHQFMTKLRRVKENPNNMGEEMRDPRFLQVLSVLLGIDMQFAGGAGGGPQFGQEDTDEEMPPLEPEPEPEPQDEEAISKQKAQEAGDAEKKLGNDFYKKRQFDEAVVHYSKAWELNKDITYLNNIGAAKFEKGDYQGAIEICEQAVAEGREQRADFKMIAKYWNSPRRTNGVDVHILLTSL
jgi:stress-induced-phosphoprotein 1